MQAIHVTSGLTSNAELVEIELTDLAHIDLLQPIALFFVSFLEQTSSRFGSAS
jgi:hypothetical protein